MNVDNSVKERELKIWHDNLRQKTFRAFWFGQLVGHAETLRRFGLITDVELRAMLREAEATHSRFTKSFKSPGIEDRSLEACRLINQKRSKDSLSNA